MNPALFMKANLWYHGQKREGGGQMLHLLLGTDWTANRDEVMK